MQNIFPLDESCINKIAAGEVIERPASVLKELVENSIDAGATQIDIYLEAGGKKLIRIWDNGSGMHENDLDICFHRYTTSKLNSADEIFGIQTNGFRGEALSSITAVAKVSIQSKTANSEHGYEIKVEQGQLLQKSSCVREIGTCVEVKDLFFNTPVRAKFLSSERAETTRTQQIMTRIALAYPKISFKMVQNNKELLNLRPAEPEIRLTQVLGAQNGRGLLKIDHHEDDWSLTGFSSKIEATRPRKQHQYIYVDKRPIWNGALNKAIERAYEQLCPGRHPIAVLHLIVSPQDVDVNVHPAKREVRFSKESDVFAFVVRALRTCILDKDDQSPLGLNTKLPNFSKSMHSSFTNFSQEEDPLSKLYQNEPKEIVETQDLFSQPESKKIIPINLASLSENKVALSPEQEPVQIQYIQIGATYILAETQSGMVLIDQFLAHQRILFERSRKSLETLNADVSQQLLFPDLLELSSAESSMMEENLDYFLAIGFDITLFGNQCFQIKGIPQDLNQNRAKDVLTELIQCLIQDKKLDFKGRLAKHFARYAATPRGQKLSNVEMSKLVDQLFSTQNPYVAPNEKPTLIRLTLEEIAQRFS